jgi:hypothetical protein
MAEKEKTQKARTIDLGAPVRIRGIYAGCEWRAELAPLGEQEESGALERLVVGQMKGGLGSPDLYGPKAAYALEVLRKIDGLGIDCAAEGWQRRVPYPIRVAIGAEMGSAYATPAGEPGLGETEKNG